MITNDKVTEFFRIANDFYKVFDAPIEKHTIKAIPNAEMLLGKCTGISVVYGTPLRVCYLSCKISNDRLGLNKGGRASRSTS